MIYVYCGVVVSPILFAVWVSGVRYKAKKIYEKIIFSVVSLYFSVFFIYKIFYRAKKELVSKFSSVNQVDF